MGQYALKQVGQFGLKRLGQYQLKQVGQFTPKWVGQYGVRLSFNGLPATANTEFEAKAIVGRIKLESRQTLRTNSYDRSAGEFGVSAFKSRNTSGYNDALTFWHTNLPSGNPYRNRRVTGVSPTLLNKLIKNIKR